VDLSRAPQAARVMQPIYEMASRLQFHARGVSDPRRVRETIVQPGGVLRPIQNVVHHLSGPCPARSIPACRPRTKARQRRARRRSEALRLLPIRTGNSRSDAPTEAPAALRKTHLTGESGGAVERRGLSVGPQNGHKKFAPDEAALTARWRQFDDTHGKPTLG
jgi:hypothetical protein